MLLDWQHVLPKMPPEVQEGPGKLWVWQAGLHEVGLSAHT